VRGHAHFAKVIKSNEAECDVIIAILGFCGILGTPEHPGFAIPLLRSANKGFPTIALLT
jgi:hypothetical protein